MRKRLEAMKRGFVETMNQDRIGSETFEVTLIVSLLVALIVVMFMILGPVMKAKISEIASAIATSGSTMIGI